MNISKIRDLAVEKNLSIATLQYLINCKSECEHLDYKESIDFSRDYDCISIVKDILGMKNIGGGYILIGVKDKTWEPIGISKPLLDDTKKLRDKIRKYSGLDIDADIIHHEMLFCNEKKIFALILIRTSRKKSKLYTPSVCIQSSFPKEEWGIRQGEIYIRDGDQTKRLDDFTKFRNFIDELDYKWQVNKIEQENSYPSPFAIESGFFRLLPLEYKNFIGRESFITKISEAIDHDSRIWIINLHGPGGVGKSALATYIGYKYFKEKSFEAILHLSAKDRELSTENGIRFLQPTLVSFENFLDKVLCLFEHNEFIDKELEQKKSIVIELLSAFKTLIILDNMETVNDGRIMEFIQKFPETIKTKVLLTSRKRTDSWEKPIHIKELLGEEARDFITKQAEEMHINNNFTNEIINKIIQISGGLPLAIKWILGEYSRTKNIETILNRVIEPDSPLLEFSFNNSWESLDIDSQQALAVLSILEEHPTINIWRSILNWPIDRIEIAISRLEEVTFVAQHNDQRTRETVYLALPITLSYARNKLTKFGDLSSSARFRYQEYKNRLDLSYENEEQCYGLFQKFEAVSETQKRAILLCRMAEGQASSLGYDEAEEFYKQALAIDPFSVYALVSYGKIKADLQSYEEAIELIQKAEKKISRLTGFYIYYNLADVYGKSKDWDRKIKYLLEALKYEPLNLMAQHALGVAYGHQRKHKEAIECFDKIIESELEKPFGPTNSIIYAINTKNISLKKMGKQKEIIPFLDTIIRQLQINKSASFILEQIESIRFNLFKELS